MENMKQKEQTRHPPKLDLRGPIGDPIIQRLNPDDFSCEIVIDDKISITMWLEQWQKLSKHLNEIFSKEKHT